jgi:hypothetical protein
MNNTSHTTATQNEMLLSFVVRSHRVPLAGSRHVHWYQFGQGNFAIARRAHEAHHEIYPTGRGGAKFRSKLPRRQALNDPWNICWREV